MQSSHSAFRPSSIAAAVILPDAPEFVLEDLKRLAERCCRDLSLTKYNSRAHKESPALDVSRRTL